VKAGKLGSRSREEMFIVEATPQGAGDDTGWPWHARLAFMVAAALACWAVPLAILYAIAF
jgi:hypothetical protein